MVSSAPPAAIRQPAPRSEPPRMGRKARLFRRMDMEGRGMGSGAYWEGKTSKEKTAYVFWLIKEREINTRTQLGLDVPSALLKFARDSREIQERFNGHHSRIPPARKKLIEHAAGLSLSIDDLAVKGKKREPSDRLEPLPAWFREMHSMRGRSGSVRFWQEQLETDPEKVMDYCAVIIAIGKAEQGDKFERRHFRFCVSPCVTYYITREGKWDEIGMPSRHHTPEALKKNLATRRHYKVLKESY